MPDLIYKRIIEIEVDNIFFFISSCSVAIIKYLRLGSIQRKEIYLTHSFGGSRAWCQHQFGSRKDLKRDGIMVEVCARGRDYLLRQQARE